MSRVETDGPLLGVFPDEQYGQVSFEMSPGETLLLYSDGFETAFSPQGELQRRGNNIYLSELASLPWPQEADENTTTGAITELGRRLDEQAGSLHQIDDVTALAITVRAIGAGVKPVQQRMAA